MMAAAPNRGNARPVLATMEAVLLTADSEAAAMPAIAALAPPAIEVATPVIAAVATRAIAALATEGLIADIAAILQRVRTAALASHHLRQRAQ
jgi:hypothetical protein